MGILVSNPKQFLNVVYQEAKMFVSSEIAFRWQIFVWVLSDTLQPVILGVLWASVAKQGGLLTVSQVITYFFLVTLVSKFTKDWSITYISNTVISGDFSKYLVKPFNYLAETLGISIGSRILRIIMLIPLLVIAYFVFKGNFEILLGFERIMLFLFALIMAFFINFLLGNTFALISFFVNQIIGLRTFYEHAVIFLSGEGIPLVAYPSWAKIFLELMPFRYTLSFPIEIIMGTVSNSQMYYGFTIASIWIVLLIIVYKVLFRFAIKKYEAFGN